MNEPRIPTRELRPWLWLPAGAVVFLVVTAVAFSGNFEASELVVISLATVAACLVTGLLATRMLRRVSFGSWGAVGLFVVLTLCAHVVCSALLTAVAPIAWGRGGSSVAEAVFFGLMLPYLVLLLTFWLSLPLAGAAGLLAWTVARRSTSLSG